MAELWLLCEGPRDVAVLRALLTRGLTAGISVEAAGGDRAIAAVAEFVAQQRGGTTAYVCDRDYRRREEAEAAFTDGNRCFYWRRHSIENYLLQPEVVCATFIRLRDRLRRLPAGIPPWAAALPTDPAVVADLLRQIAQSLAPREAARMACGRLWEALSETAGRIQQRFLAVPLGSDATVCRQSLVDETERLVVKGKETATSPHLTAEAIKDRYDQLLAGVTTSAYFSDLRLLEEFNGRDLFDQFQTVLQARGICFSDNYLAERLIEVLPDLYRATPGLFTPDDFRDLANGVRALGGLPALP